MEKALVKKLKNLLNKYNKIDYDKTIHKTNSKANNKTYKTLYKINQKMSEFLKDYPDTCYILCSDKNIIPYEYPRSAEKLLYENKKYEAMLNNLQSSQFAFNHSVLNNCKVDIYRNYVESCLEKIRLNNEMIEALRNGHCWSKLW